MAIESVVQTQQPEFNIEDARDCIAKARGIAELIGPYAISTLGVETAQSLSCAVWALCDQLDQLAAMTGLDPQREVAA